MREIKFRAWDNENRVWQYGWLTKLLEGARKFWSIIREEDDGGFVRYYVHEEKSIGQYTGLKDKNEKEIYEGDIVTAHYFYFNGGAESDGSITGIVSFDDTGCFVIRETDNRYLYFWETSHFEEPCILVIGNIYENPELLEN